MQPAIDADINYRSFGTDVSSSDRDMEEIAHSSLQLKLRLVREFKITSPRKILVPDSMQSIQGPDDAHRYWQRAIETGNHYTPELESCYVLALNARSRVMGHYLVAFGTLNCVLIHPREVFRAAILLNAYSIVLMHNHPSGDPTPSDQDISLTRDLVRAGEFLKIPLYDHVIVGAQSRSSLKERGMF